MAMGEEAATAGELKDGVEYHTYESCTENITQKHTQRGSMAQITHHVQDIESL